MTKQVRGSRSGDGASYRNTRASAERYGGIRFNTYNWDFAPYMLAMKRKVQSHLYPPYAFTHMGMISGTNIVHFVVMPDGSVRDLEIMTSDAHYSLDLASIRAIELSLPFLPLPMGFPEDYLEVTAHFSYVIDR
jgi:outer membrane biosynthesis protein TonB